MGCGLTWATKGKRGYEESASSGGFWRTTLIESDTRLRAGRRIAKGETEAAIEAFERLKGRGHPNRPPPLVSDGWGGYAMRRWWRCGGRCPRIEEGDGLRARRSQGRAGATFRWSSSESTGEW